MTSKLQIMLYVYSTVRFTNKNRSKGELYEIYKLSLSVNLTVYGGGHADSQSGYTNELAVLFT